MYAHYLFLRRRLDQAARSGNREAVLAAIRDETRFAGRLTFTNMVHARPLMGREFVRRFKKYEAALASLPEPEKAGWRQIGEPPTREELERIWAGDKKALGLDRYPLSYPPRLAGGKAVVTDRSPLFLKPPANLRPGVSIAKTPPEVDFMYYPGQNHPGGPWSVWGDGTVVDGKYYSAIGDHLSPRGTAMVYEYDAASKKMRVLADLRTFLESAGAIPPGMDYVPAKIHTRIQMGRDGWLYYATHRGSAHTCDDRHGYLGDWILRTHPRTGKTEIVAAQPVPKNSIPAGFIDPERLIFYGGTAPGPDAPNKTVQFLAYDVANRRILKVADERFQRCAILSQSTGRLYWDGKMYDPLTNQITRSAVPAVRSATGETPEGIVYGTTERSADIWAFHTKTGTLEQLGSGAVGKQEYTTSMDADAGGRYLYYIPGAHGGTAQDGAPVIQCDTRTRRRKVIAFLHDFYFDKYRYHLDGTFSTALDAKGETLYVTWNGMREGQPRFWESCALTVIHIPASERE